MQPLGFPLRLKTNLSRLASPPPTHFDVDQKTRDDAREKQWGSNMFELELISLYITVCMLTVLFSGMLCQSFVNHLCGWLCFLELRDCQWPQLHEYLFQEDRRCGTGWEDFSRWFPLQPRCANAVRCTYGFTSPGGSMLVLILLKTSWFVKKNHNDIMIWIIHKTLKSVKINTIKGLCGHV